MPSKIWLHKNTKYSTGDMVCGYQYDFVQGIEDEGGIENFVKYVPADTFIKKACEWLENRFAPDGSIIPTYASLIQDFRKTMEE